MGCCARGRAARSRPSRAPLEPQLRRPARRQHPGNRDPHIRIGMKIRVARSFFCSPLAGDHARLFGARRGGSSPARLCLETPPPPPPPPRGGGEKKGQPPPPSRPP